MINEELLEDTIQPVMEICNRIYTKIDRTPKEEMSEIDFELVKTFNELVDINQRNLDILFPERGKFPRKFLSFKKQGIATGIEENILNE